MFEKECQGSCLVAKLATEISSSAIQCVSFSRRHAANGRNDRETCREGLEKKVMRQDLDPAATAALIQDLWMGASQRSQVQRNVAHCGLRSLSLRRYLAA